MSMYNYHEQLAQIKNPECQLGVFLLRVAMLTQPIRLVTLIVPRAFLIVKFYVIKIYLIVVPSLPRTKCEFFLGT